MKKLFTLITGISVAIMSFAQTADIARNVSAADIGDFNGAADMEYSFDSALVQTGISEYRFMVAKSGATFQADTVTNFVTHAAPLAANVTATLSAGALDIDGDAIVAGVAYDVYVFSLGNTGMGYADSLSASASITLNDPTVYTIPFNEGFEAGFISSDWALYDNDVDGLFWELSAAANGTTTIGDYCVSSASWTSGAGAINPDNFICTPPIDMGNDFTKNYELSWNVYAQDQSWVSEFYEVYVSTTGNTVNDFTSGTSLFSETLTTSTGFMTRRVSLDAYIGDTIWIAFRHYNSNDWFRINLDEISILEKPKFDIELSDLTTNEYHRIPLRQSQNGFDFGANVMNNGINDATNVEVTVDIDFGTTTYTSTPTTITSGSNQDITVATGHTFTDPGDYDYILSVTMDSVDQVPANNILGADTIKITDTVYARGAGPTGILGGALASYDNNEFGMMYELHDVDTLSSISVDLLDPDPAATIQMNVYSFDDVAGPTTLLGTTGAVLMPSFTAGVPFTVTLPIDTFLTLVPGKYMVTVYEEFGSSTIGMTVDQSTEYIPNVAWTTSDVTGAWSANGAFWTGDFFWPIRMNLGESPYAPELIEGCMDPNYLEYNPDANVDDGSCATLAVPGCTDSLYVEYDPDANVDDGSCATLDTTTGIARSLKVNFDVYPNPAQDNVTITSDVVIENIALVNMFGQTVKNISVNEKSNAHAVNISDVAEGMYMVEVTTKNGASTKMLTITK